MLLAINSVPSGIVSFTIAVPNTLSVDVFVKVIVYVIISPTFAVVAFFPSIVAVLLAVITGFFTSFVGVSST